MKRKILSIVIPLLVFSISVIPGLAKMTNRYLTSPNYYEKVYQENPSTYNLLVLCDAYLDNNDKKYLSYIDKLLNAEDYEQAIKEYYGHDENKNLTITNALKIATVGVAATNNSIDDFNSSMKKYYVELESGNRPQYFYKILVGLDTSFVYENKEAIIQIFCEIAEQEDIPLFKLRELLNILAFYNVTNETNEAITEIQQEIDDICSQSNFDESYEDGIKSILEEYEGYWEDLLRNGSVVTKTGTKTGDG